MKKVSILLLLIAAVCLAAGCRHTYDNATTPTWPRVQAEAIRLAGERLGVPVETDNVSSFSQGGAVFTTATARAWRTSPATDLPRGVDFAVAYLDSPGQDFAPGFYTLRAFAEPRGIGTVEGRVQVLNAARETVTELPATIDVTSMTLPPDAVQRIPNIAVTRIPVNSRSCDYNTQVCYCCTNGQIVCVPRLVNTNLDVRAVN